MMPPVLSQVQQRNQARRKALAALVRQTLADRGLELSVCGDKTDDLEPFNRATGFWQSPGHVTNKPPRWILQLVNSETWQARLASTGDGTPIPGSARLAHFNTARRSVGGIFIRVHPAIQVGRGTYHVHRDWEWILFFAFAEALRNGSSGQLLEEYDPHTGQLRYMDDSPRYVFASLFQLNEPDEVFSHGGVALTYSEATEAMSRFLQVEVASVSDTESA
jgi:hypothetical protein